MRIIGRVIALSAVMWALGTLDVKAGEQIQPDINIKKETIFTMTSAVSEQNPLIAEGIIAAPTEPPIKTEEDLKNEAILDNWKRKQVDKWKSLISEPFIINASAYTAAADECGKSDGVTSSGIKAKAGRTIACPAQFPFGAKIKIADMGIFTCEDRGGAIKGNKIDIFMQTKQEAFAFGRRNLEAQVIF